jgi:thiamine-monophosphate kinase
LPERLSEEDIISLITALLAGQAAGPELLLGPGDDCALFKAEGPLAATTDMLVENVHFSTSYMTFWEIGYRAMAANLSDLAAMGARPRYGLLSLGLAAPPREHQVKDLLGGMLDLAARHGLILIGGDTVKAPVLTINLCLWGESPSPLLRSRAEAGDSILVSGPLGLSAAGLACLRRGLRDPAWAPLIAAHKLPVPRLAAGQVLASSGLAGAVMDISDGLATDLARLSRSSRIKAVLEAPLIPLSRELRQAAGCLNHNPLLWALGGGEDFELLFTCRPQNEKRLVSLLTREAQVAPYRIGRVESGSGVYLRRQEGCREISREGYDHFRI